MHTLPGISPALGGSLRVSVDNSWVAKNGEWGHCSIKTGQEPENTTSIQCYVFCVTPLREESCNFFCVNEMLIPPLMAAYCPWHLTGAISFTCSHFQDRDVQRVLRTTDMGHGAGGFRITKCYQSVVRCISRDLSLGVAGGG